MSEQYLGPLRKEENEAHESRKRNIMQVRKESSRKLKKCNSRN
jgi:hypothetical protein